MVKQIMVRDEIYRRLMEIKGDGSFSDAINFLLDANMDRVRISSISALAQAIEKQNKLLEELLYEVRRLNSKLSIPTPAAPTTINHATHVTPVTDENLPSYLRDNPWVSILAAKK
jgi:predicted CopG family antitoxin